MSEWTPGPWEADGCIVWARSEVSKPHLYGAGRPYHDGRLDRLGRPALYSPICDTDDGDYVRSPNPEADAHLIAAAPDLYEALERMLLVAKSLSESVHEEDIAMVNAALARARGETQ